MIRNALRPATSSSRTFSALQQSRFASSLVFLEHKGGKLNDSSLSAVTAAKQVDANVSIYVIVPAAAAEPGPVCRRMRRW